VGQKIHPGGLRVGVIHDWKSNWMVGKKEFAGALIEDIKIREHILKKLSHAGLSDILIRKDKQRITIDIYTARPGIVIGKSGVEVDALRKEVHAMTQKNVHININEIKRPELDAKLVAQSIAEQLQNRVSFRRAMKRSLASAIRSGAAGVKVKCSGRLGGSEMSRSEQYSEGRVPLHTIRADIDYGFVEARTPTGRIGVKVWINKGEIMPQGYSGMAEKKETRLGDQDTARRRGGVTEGLGASRESGRNRSQDREGLGPVRRGRPGQRGGQQRPGGGGPGNRAGAPRNRGGATRPPAEGTSGGRQRPDTNVDAPIADDAPVSAEVREPVVDAPVVESTPAPVVEAPAATVPAESVPEAAPKAEKKPVAEKKPAVEKKPAAEKPAAKKAAPKKAAPKKADS
jgi:small subunit ribosomal protein S3